MDWQKIIALSEGTARTAALVAWVACLLVLAHREDIDWGRLRKRARAFGVESAFDRLAALMRRKASPGEALVIGYRLRQMREEAGLSQGALAERLGVSQQAVSQNERWTANASWAQIVRWCHACGMRPELGLRRPEGDASLNR